MAELVTGEAVALDIRVARLASRGCAFLLDVFFQVTILNFGLSLVGMTSLVADEAWTAGLSIATMAAVVVGYPCLCETLTRGRTLGKLALGLRVVADDGGPVRFRQALVRGLAGAVELWSLTGAPALLTSLGNRRGKRLGDLFAGTIVIQERVPHGPMFGPVAVMPPQLAGWAQRLELSLLSDGLALAARQYLARFWELLPEVRDALGERITEQVFAVVSPPPPAGVRPEIVLSAVLAERRRRDEWRLAQRRARRMRMTVPASAWPGEPAMAMAGPPPAAAVPQGPPQPPAFSAPGPGQPQFLPPSDYGSGPYQDVLHRQDAPYGPAYGASQGPAMVGAPQAVPAGVPQAPPGVPQVPPAGVPQMPAGGSPQSPFAGVPQMPPAGASLMPPAGAPQAPPPGVPQAPSSDVPQVPPAGGPHTPPAGAS
ncbi:RDD family protein [Actinomadura miaoliensis]|uniref:RDD domain-containing protein n=1 Tax=Actinomadura miaoliensis TaxID=430685 RepID=A0ABP7WLA1_9ACTN